MKAFPIKKCAPIAATAATVLLLVGCGDDAGNGPSNADQIVARFDELSACTAKQEGTVAYVKDERIAYVCESGRWKPDEGGTSSAGWDSYVSLGTIAAGNTAAAPFTVAGAATANCAVPNANSIISRFDMTFISQIVRQCAAASNRLAAAGPRT